MFSKITSYNLSKNQNKNLKVALFNTVLRVHKEIKLLEQNILQ